MQKAPNNQVSNIQVQSTDEKIISVLKKFKIKVTTPKMLVLGALANRGTPMSVEEISKSLSGIAPAKTTMYRILSEGVELGFIKEIHLKDGLVRYETNIPMIDDCHCHHVVCKGCGKVEHIELENHEIEKHIHKMSGKIKGFPVVDDHSLEFFGFCAYCCSREKTNK